MRLGNFSVSLAVKDLAASREFYEKLGFRVIGGNGRNFSILQNETSTIGLFQGMFDKNILTFNPGWDRTCATLPDYDDVRDIQRTLTSRGLALPPGPTSRPRGPRASCSSIQTATRSSSISTCPARANKARSSGGLLKGGPRRNDPQARIRRTL